MPSTDNITLTCGENLFSKHRFIFPNETGERLAKKNSDKATQGPPLEGLLSARSSEDKQQTVVRNVQIEDTGVKLSEAFRLLA